jgi:hypothetical protein
VALDFAQRAVQKGRKEYAADTKTVRDLDSSLKTGADILDSLGRLDEAIALDAERMAVMPRGAYPDLLPRGHEAHS